MKFINNYLIKLAKEIKWNENCREIRKINEDAYVFRHPLEVH
jgi:hypothetical protein